MIGFRSAYEILYWICLPGVLFCSFALSFPYIPIRLGIQVRMMQLFLERVFILSRSLVMIGIDIFLFRRAWRTDLSLNG